MPHVSLVYLVGCLSACVLGLNACATQLLHTARTIEVGASPAQVREVLGTPYDRQFHRNQEAWQYCETGVLRDTFVVVWFVDQQVTRISDYHNAVGDLGFFCGSHMQPIRWQDPQEVQSEHPPR
jgi:hypothetical protein